MQRLIALVRRPQPRCARCAEARQVDHRRLGFRPAPMAIFQRKVADSMRERASKRPHGCSQRQQLELAAAAAAQQSLHARAASVPAGFVAFSPGAKQPYFTLQSQSESARRPNPLNFLLGPLETARRTAEPPNRLPRGPPGASRMHNRENNALIRRPRLGPAARAGSGGAPCGGSGAACAAQQQVLLQGLAAQQAATNRLLAALLARADASCAELRAISKCAGCQGVFNVAAPPLGNMHVSNDFRRPLCTAIGGGYVACRPHVHTQPTYTPHSQGRDGGAGRHVSTARAAGRAALALQPRAGCYRRSSAPLSVSSGGS